MRRSLVVLALLAISGFAAREAAAQIDVPGVGLKKTAQSTMNFLKVGVVPNAVSLGDAYTAVGKGVEALFYNPAGLSEVEGKAEVFVGFTKWIADINYFAAGASWSLGNVGAVGVSFVSVDYGDIIGTRLVPASEIGTDVLGYRETGPLSNVGAYALGLGFSRSITDVFTMGAQVKAAYQSLGQSVLASGTKTNEMTKLAFDMGVKYYTPIRSFRFGMSIRNFSSSVKYEEITTHLPLTFAVGCAADLADFLKKAWDRKDVLLASFEFTHPNDYSERVHFGLRYNFMNLLALNLGYVTNHDLCGFSAGFSVTGKALGAAAELSYSYSDVAIFDDLSRISLRLRF
jgi:hypothetical protein